MKLLIIGDYHAHPDLDNHRATWLGKFIVDERPDVVVCMGDFADLPSLCNHSSKSSLESSRYQADVEAAEDAMDKLFSPLRQLNGAQRRFKKAQYKPRLVMTLGNHEARIDRLVAEDPRLEGKISTEDLPYSDWEVYPYNQRVFIEDVAFCHHLPSGAMGRAISGKTIGARAVSEGLMSSVVGHAHTYDYAEATRWDGGKVMGINVGCYTHPDMIEGWNLATHQKWWRGVVLVNNFKNGYGDVQKISQEVLYARYG